MLKMILAAHGGILLTNDGNAILRELDVAHPAAKSMLELSRAQDEEVGDGTTSVVVLGKPSVGFIGSYSLIYTAGELLKMAAPWLEKNLHPTILIDGYKQALVDALAHLETLAVPVDINDNERLLPIVRSTLGTKFVGRWGDLMCNLALKAVKTVSVTENGQTDVDIKRYVRVEKVKFFFFWSLLRIYHLQVPGGSMAESQVLDGVMLQKDVLHSKMRRRIENPRILLLDCPLEYKKVV